MKEKKRMFIILACLVVIVGFFVILAVVQAKENAQRMEKFNEYFTSETEKLIYFGRDDCYYCTVLNPAKKALLDGKVDYHYIDTNKISDNLLDKMLDKLGISEFGTPTLVIVKNSEVLKVQGGIFDEKTDNIEELQDFLEAYNILEKSE